MPGCSMMTAIACLRRANSMDMHLLSWFCALLLALRMCHGTQHQAWQRAVGINL